MVFKEFVVWAVILLEIRILLSFFSERLREWFQNINVTKYGPNNYPTTNSAPHTHSFSFFHEMGL
jgi:hypothetical protein